MNILIKTFAKNGCREDTKGMQILRVALNY